MTRRRPKRQERETCECSGGCQPRKLSPSVAALLQKIQASWLLATGEVLANGRFRCPLCLRDVPEFCATLAHAPSAGLGGKAVGLLCRACNSYLGTTYEAYLKLQADRATGQDVIRVGPSGAEARVYMRAEVKHDLKARHHDIALRPAGKQRDYEEALKRLRSEGGIGRLQLGRISTTADTGGLLAWTYLLWFERLGYPFALVRALRRVRAALLTDDVDDLGRSPVLSQGPSPRRWEKGRPVVVRLDAGESSVSAIGWSWPSALAILPLPHDHEASVYDRLDDMVEDHDSVDVRLRPLDDLWPVAFGLAPGNPKVPTEGNLTLFLDSLRVAGSTPEEARMEATHTISPKVRRHEPQPELLRPPVPQLPVDVKPGQWADVAMREVRRVALDPQSVTAEVAAAIGAMAGDAGSRTAAIAILRERLDAAAVAHLEDLERHALRGMPYRHAEDRSSAGELPRHVDHALRSVPRAHRPQVVEITVRMISADSGLAQAFAVLRTPGDGLELLGPFYTAATMLAALRVRMRRLRAQLRGSEAI